LFSSSDGSLLTFSGFLDFGNSFLSGDLIDFPFFIPKPSKSSLSNSSSLKITIRKILTEVSSETGSNRIDIKPNEDVTLEIRLNNLDIGETIKNVTVFYNWQFGQGQLEDTDDDGIYEIDLDDIPEGTYTVTISIFGEEDYEFEEYELTISASRTAQEIMTQNIILGGTVTGTLALGSYLFMYQTYLKYPTNVRKSRKLRKSISKSGSIKQKIDVPSRGDLMDDLLKEDLEGLGIKKGKSIKSPDKKELPKSKKPEKVNREPSELENKNLTENEKLREERKKIRESHKEQEEIKGKEKKKKIKKKEEK